MGGFHPDSQKLDLLLPINIEQAQFHEVCLNFSVHIPEIPAGTHSPVRNKPLSWSVGRLHALCMCKLSYDNQLSSKGCRKCNIEQA